MPVVVVDASVVLDFAFDEGDPAETRRLMQIVDQGAWIPQHFRLEISNAIVSRVRRGVFEAYRAAEFFDLVLRLPLHVDGETTLDAWSTGFRLANRHRLTIYDACYLALAQRLDLPLATFDKALRAAAEAESVALA